MRNTLGHIIDGQRGSASDLQAESFWGLIDCLVPCEDQEPDATGFWTAIDTLGGDKVSYQQAAAQIGHTGDFGNNQVNQGTHPLWERVTHSAPDSIDSFELGASVVYVHEFVEGDV